MGADELSRQPRNRKPRAVNLLPHPPGPNQPGPLVLVTALHPGRHAPDTCVPDRARYPILARHWPNFSAPLMPALAPATTTPQVAA